MHMEITILALSLLSMQRQRHQESHLDVRITIYFPVVSRLNGMWIQPSFYPCGLAQRQER